MSDLTPPVTLTKSNNGDRRPVIDRLLRGRVSRRSAAGQDVVRLLAFSVAVLVVAISSVAFAWGSGGPSLLADDAASATIKATDTVTYQSDLRTEERRHDAFIDARNIVLSQDDDVRPNQVAALRAFLDQVDVIRSDAAVTDTDSADLIRTLLEDLNALEANRIVTFTPAAWERVKSEAIRLVDTTLANPVQTDDVARVREDLDSSVLAQLTADEQGVAIAVARPFVRANVFVDEVQTLMNRQRAADSVEPFMVTVLAGQAVVRDGDIVTAYDIEKLEKIGLLSPSIDLSTRAARAGLMAILTLALVSYLARFHRQIWQGRQLLLVSIVVIGPIIMGRLILPHNEIQYMFPIAASAMLLAVLLDFEIAVVIGAILSMYLGVIAEMSFELAVLYFLASIAGAFVLWRAERTMTFVWAGLAVAVTSFAVAVCFNALDGAVDSGLVGERLVETLVAGALASSLTFLSFSLLGSLFGITTHLQLLELAHPNQPLLYRLAREAPGTYHHSIVVSNLAESGVEIVGGDPLFARVAVLYHDVGKITRPTFFIENQANLENPHDLLDPRVSARVIVDHVTDGARLAKKARLPQSMIDVIEQHHGTSLIRYFYAKSQEAGDDAAECDYRYPGPKPQTKEAGVIMMADSVEAAVRSHAMGGHLASGKGIVKEGSETLESIVDNVIQERLDDGQFTECDLTLREVELIRRTFVQILAGIYHPRIEYPAVEMKTTAAASAPTPAG
ncbi:MAG TPA: HDIG domain-containing protein [Thermomicrobiales bacterium]|nr:HDIG domain-containing protein [Thermomicrobiales bacterium]